MKVMRRLKITITRRRLAPPPPGDGRAFCPACGREIKLQAGLPDAALANEAVLPPRESGLSQAESAAVTSAGEIVQREAIGLP